MHVPFSRTPILAFVALGGVALALALPAAHKPVLGPAEGPAAIVTPDSAPASPAAVKLPETTLAAGPVHFEAHPARTAIHAGGEDLDVIYEMSAPAAADGQRLPVDMALVLDRSGSMDGAPLARALDAARQLVARLTPDDRLAVIDFGSNAVLRLPLTRMTVEGRSMATTQISAVQCNGGTNISEALLLAGNELRPAMARETAIRRIVLLSDGEANEGITGAGLVDDVVRSLNENHIRLSALGLGLQFDEKMMSAMAFAGGGQYRFLRDADETSAALTTELAVASSTAASMATLSLAPAAGVQVQSVMGYSTTRDGGVVTARLADLPSGEHHWVSVRVHVLPGAAGRRELMQARLSYEEPGQAAAMHAETVTAAVEATQDEQRVTASVDLEAAKKGIRARWAASVLDALSVGNVRSIFGASTAALSGEADRIGAHSLVEELGSETQRGLTAYNTNAYYGQKSLSNFGYKNQGH